MNNVAIILGAGNSTRMKSDKSKLLLEIFGKTVIERSVGAFLEISDIDEIIITAREQDIEKYISMFPDDRITFVIGGKTRQESVKNAVETIDEANLLVIHDGARPLVKTEDIDKTIRAADEFGAAATGVFVKDTIKIVDDDNFVSQTPDRSKLFAVQTPQAFRFEEYKEALDKAKGDYTDDCALVEAAGFKVKLVEGSYSNIKITTPEDISIAEGILKR